GHWPAAKAPGELPPDVHPPEGGIDSNVIGKVNFLLQREGAGAPASHVESIQRDGDITAPLLAEGLLPLVIGAPDLATKLNSVRLPEEKISLPPIPVPNVGYLCIVADGDGLGSLDCDGGHMGGTLAITQDHNVSEPVDPTSALRHCDGAQRAAPPPPPQDHNVSELADPTCALGCREGAACQRIWLEGPHQTLC